MVIGLDAPVSPCRDERLPQVSHVSLTDRGPEGQRTTYSYDPAGLELSETDNAGATTFAYDADGRECWSFRSSAVSTNGCASPPAGSTAYTYEPGSSAVQTLTDPNGHTCGRSPEFAIGDQQNSRC